MRIRVKLSITDYVAFNDYAIKRQMKPNGPLLNFFKNLVLWLVIAVLISTLLQVMAGHATKLHWHTAITIAVPLLLYIFVTNISQKRLVRRLDPIPDGYMLGEKEFEFSSEGVKVKGVDVESFYRWAAFVSVEENGDSAYIFLDKLAAIILPLSAFETRQEQEKLLQWIKECCAQ